MSKKLVALEGVKEGNKFFTCAEENEDHTKLSNGEVAYNVLGIFDNTDDGTILAQRACGIGVNREQDIQRLSDYLSKISFNLPGLDKDYCEDLAIMLVDKERRSYPKE